MYYNNTRPARTPRATRQEVQRHTQEPPVLVQPGASQQFGKFELIKILEKFAPTAIVIGQAADVIRGLEETSPCIQVLDDATFGRVSGVVWECGFSESPELLSKISFRGTLYRLTGGVGITGYSYFTPTYQTRLTPEWKSIELNAANYTRINGIYVTTFQYNHALMTTMGWHVNNAEIRQMVSNLLNDKVIEEIDIEIIGMIHRVARMGAEQRKFALGELTERIKLSKTPEVFLDALREYQ